MPVTVVVGGQFGSEGKGKVAHFIAQESQAKVAVRVGGGNSGHTVVSPDGHSIILRHLPTAAILPDTICVLGAGTYIDFDVLLHEMEVTGLAHDRLFIDPNAVILSDSDKAKEQSSDLHHRLGSTLSGTGAAVCRRVERAETVLLAKDDERLRHLVRPVVSFMRRQLENGERVIIEGTQGFGLSLLHSPHYPYVTSRDTTAASFVAEAGLSPIDVDDIVLVLRTFPIRVAGNSGPLPHEITWEQLSDESASSTPIVEYTSVTKKVRRVAHFDLDVVLRAIAVNNPTRIVLNHVDYLDMSCHASTSLSKKANSFVEDIETALGTSIDYVGSGPSSLIKRYKK